MLPHFNLLPIDGLYIPAKERCRSLSVTKYVYLIRNLKFYNVELRSLKTLEIIALVPDMALNLHNMP